METISDRIEKTIEDNGLTKTQFAKIIGISTGNLGDWKRGKSMPGANALAKIAEHFDVSLDWLILGKKIEKLEQIPGRVSRISEGEEDRLEFRESGSNSELLKYLKDLSEEDINVLTLVAKRLSGKGSRTSIKTNTPRVKLKKEPETSKSNVCYLPVLSQIPAGRPVSTEDLIEGYLPVPVHMAKSGTFLTRVRGDSMIGDEIFDGDVVQIRMQPTVENGEIAAVRLNGEVTLKHFFNNNGSFILRSSNPEYSDIIANIDDDITIIGKFIAKFSKQDVDVLLDRFREDGAFFNTI
ncbi:helix-turn-helix domain-containing protein [Desulforamulus ruminis]|uniref:LexA repressor n=1 Tax=Desulforamulus ruminis (strain ATCC 23193 / DSM 2154 / NCIMB 8452 / DL) TaxID=696281 RepID=F6DTI3_DESRL|nr:S24 family peptidase [Desulforamulus ruminis]AEG60045.1 LexA repressor [Desulforamulus ruminis DSM 2154]